MTAQFEVGDRVRIHGGFEDGYTGIIVANEPQPATAEHGPRPFRYRVELDADGAHDTGRPTIGGLHPFALELE